MTAPSQAAYDDVLRVWREADTRLGACTMNARMVSSPSLSQQRSPERSLAA
jgi:hypothetical protein